MRYVVSVLCLMLVACGGGSPVGPSPVILATPTPAPTASRAVVVVGAKNNTFTVRSSERVLNLVLECGDYHVEWVFGETAGLGSKLVRSDVYLRAPDGSISGRRVTDSADVIPAGGTFEAFSNRSDCGYVGRSLPDTIVALWDFMDDRGNAQHVESAVGFVRR